MPARHRERERERGRGSEINPLSLSMLVKMAVAAVRLVLLDPGVKWLVLALAVWVVVSAFHGRIRRRDAGLAKLMVSALLVLAFSTVLRDRSAETLASFFAVWVALLVFCVRPWWKFTGAGELLRGFSMGMLGCLALRHPRIETYALALAVWIALSAFSLLSETPERDGADTASEEVGSSSSSSTFARKDLGVFLSFNRGPDIPDAFIDFLMVQLTRSGISVFGEGKKLPEGEDLVEVIKRSNVSIPIISKGYASSESCLVELGLMLECRRTNGRTIIPIFYDVDPSDVRLVRGSFEISLKEHEMKGTDGGTIDAWGRALCEVGVWDGFYTADNNSWSNYKLLKQLHLDVLQLFGKQDIKENLVGTEDRVREVMTKLGVYYKDGQSTGLHGGDVRVVGIYGTGGVGKTTLAKIVYNDISSLFDGCSYLEDIRERFTQSEGLKSLQNQLIADLLKRSCPMFTCEEGAHNIRQRFHSMRVLIILDDVSHHHQLEPFIGNLSCFGPRSRIIVTTRDYGLIDVPAVAERYEVKPLKPDQALFLFQRHASHVLPFTEGYDTPFDEIISVTGRIPLAIEVLAPLLCRTPTTLWQHTLKMMSKRVDPVERVLMASFEFLNDKTIEILLDIACFFVGKEIANPFSMWCACGYDPLSGLEVLIGMSLVQIGDNNKLWMHDQLRNLCQQIVKNEDPKRPERRSRLWNHEDAVSLLKGRKGTKMVQALNLKFESSCHDCFTCEEFELLPGLRFLKLGKAKIIGDSKNALSNLRWLDWQGCLETFGACDLHLKELVILDLSWSKVAHDWKGWSQIKMPQLRILNLTGCTGLLMTPDLSGFEKLEILILEHCSRLVKIDASVAQLKCLVTLNLKFCTELSMLPKELNHMKEMRELLIDETSIKDIPSTLANMKKLVSVSASNCFSLTGLPESIGQLEALSVLLLDSVKIVELPHTIGDLVQLKQLSLRNCCCLGVLPDSIGKLGGTLIELDVSGTGISKLPGSITNLRSLKVLKMDSCFIREFPCDIGRLTNLEEIHALRCRSLEGDVPSDIGELKSLRMLVLAYTRISSLPSCIQSLCCLQTLDLLNCNRIEALPILPSSLTHLHVISRNMKVVPFIDHLTKLEELCLGDEDLKGLKLPSTQRIMNSILTRAVALSFLWPQRFPRLKVLELSHSRITDLCLRDECLPQLTKLVLSGANLRRVPQLPSTLSFLSVAGCLSLKRLPTVQCLKSLTELRLSHSAVREVEGLGELEALEIIDISHCEIRNLEGLSHLTSLRSLTLSDCDHLRKLPNISNLRMLKILEICRCREINNIQDLQEIRSSLEKLHVGECKDEDSPEGKEGRGVEEVNNKDLAEEASAAHSRVSSAKTKYRNVSDWKKEVPEPKDGPTAQIVAETSTFQELVAPTKIFRLECLLDEGGFGRVNAGHLGRSGQVIASPLRIQEMEKSTESDYEVFLSFRGPDTRRDIADYLYYSLIRAGIQAYRDNEELLTGEEIGPELVQAIKQSEILIPILSKGYAASPWCLMELVHMVECKENWGRKIMPVFYDVAPSEVRYQTGSYGEAINLHINKQQYADETIQNWKAALSKVGALGGWALKERGKGEFTKEVVQKLLIELKKNYLAVSNCLVEMDNQVDQIMEKIGEQTTETKIIGIRGMGGVGKTTLATMVYNKLSADFDNCCFLSDVRETKIMSLQNRLISEVIRKECLSINSIDEGITEIKNRLSSKKVLLVLDDVDHNTQLDALVGVGECQFGRGSKVIITTRDKELVKRVDFQHELTGMDFDRSLQLFSRHAFGTDHPPAEYVALSKKAVIICGHLPLALEIVGSLLYGNDINKWKNVLKKLETIPNKEVKSKLNISFEALETQEKEMFLDVCCFFVGFDVRIVTYMWDSCKFSPECSLEVLKHRSLIKIAEGNRLWVHDQLRDLGRDIVRERAKLKPGKQSGVWDHEEATDVLEIKEGRENVEAICLKFDHQFQDFIENEESISLSNLRFLQVDCVDLDENHVQHFPSTNWFQRNLIMLRKLRWLSWDNFPIFFKFTGYSLMKILILDLSRSEITDEWEGWNHLKMAKNLKVLNLTGCRNIRRTLDFSAHENLEQLILQGCTRLVQVDRSIGKLKRLVLLNLEGCGKLQTLPDEMQELEALTELLVDGTSITNIPEWKGMGKLETLNATSCGLLSKCNLAGCSASLLYLCLSDTRISELPFGNFGSLVELNLSQSSVRELPNSIETMKNLRVLRISYTPLERLPSALGMLEKLEEIHADSCRNLCGEIPSEIGRLSFLKILSLTCTRIANISKLPESMTNLYLTGSLQMRCPDLSNLLNLRVLMLGLEHQTPSHLTRNLNLIGGLRKLESLFLCCDSLVTLPSDFNLLLKLRKLELIVNNLECLPRLPQNLSYFRIHGCRLMQKSINLSYLEKLSELEVHSCELLIEIQGLEPLKNLQRLCLNHLPLLVKLPDLTGLKKLRKLWIEDCPKLVEVRGQLESLEELYLQHCPSVEQLLDPLSFKHMEELSIYGCWNLKEIRGLDDSKNLSVLYVGDLPLLEKLPDLTNSKELEDLVLKRCPRLVEIRGRLKSLKRLEIDCCGSLQRFSDPSSFKKLQCLRIKECERLEEILESDEYRDLKKVRRAFKGLPGFMDSRPRRKYSIPEW